MPYTSNFTLLIHEVDEDGAVSIGPWSGSQAEMDLIADLQKKYSGAYESLSSTGGSEAMTEWTDMIDNMKEFSLDHPDYIFIMYEEGQEDDDRVKHYFHKGKVQSAQVQITYDEFNPDKLN